MTDKMHGFQGSALDSLDFWGWGANTRDGRLDKCLTDGMTDVRKAIGRRWVSIYITCRSWREHWTVVIVATMMVFIA